MFGKVAVLMGGNSAEREISLISGGAVFAALQRSGVDCEMIDTKLDDYIGKLTNGNYARAFIALHGRGGEDGAIQGLLEHLHIPYTGSGILGSALGMDKVRSKRMWQSLGLATPPFALWEPGTGVEEYVKIFGLPLTVKPVYEGSSIGVTRVNSAADFDAACTLAKQYGAVIIEPWIIGDEYTVCILGDKVLPSIKITAKENFYTYNAKYFSDETEHVCPGLELANDENNLQRLALEAFRALGATGWGRVDFIRDVNGDFWLLEVNTAPGMTPHSNMPLAAKVAGYSFDDLVMTVLSQTLNVESEAYATGTSSI